MRGDGASTDYSISVGGVATDGADVLELCLRSLPGFTRAHFVKYYEQNPLGPPAFVVARDPSGALVGTAGLHPAELLVDGEVRLVGVAGDFVVADGLRGFGPAVALQRKLLPLVEQRGWDLSYGIPNAAARAVLSRVGYRPLGELARLERQIQAPERLRAAIRRGSGRENERERYAFETPTQFDQRFDELWQHQARAMYVPYRSASRLDWRYEVGSAANRFSLSVATLAGRIAAFSVSQVSYGARRIVDLGWIDAESLRAVLRFDLRRAAAARLGAVDLLYLGSHEEAISELAALGFVAVSTTPVVAYSARGSDAFGTAAQWELFEGAFDI